MTLEPLRKVTCKYTRKNFKHEPIYLNTFYSYVEKLTKHVEGKIKKLLFDSFGLVFDGWESGSTHYVGLLATFPSKSKIYESKLDGVLLSFSPLLNEDSLDTEKHVEFIEYHRGIYKKTKDNVVCLSGDNCSVNKLIAMMIDKPLVGCASHLFNLAVQDTLLEHQPLIKSVNEVMVKLSKVKAMEKLRKFTDSGPIRNNATRWSSINNMIKRFCDIKEHLPNLGIDVIDDLTTGPSDCRKISKTMQNYE